MTAETPGSVQPTMAKPKAAPVRVVARKDPTAKDGVKFELHSKWKVSDHRLQFDKKVDKIKKKDPYLVEFSLEDPDSIGLRFVTPKEEAMWVSPGVQGKDPPCPTNECHNARFEAVSVDDSSLTVNNPDEHVENIAFTLRFWKPAEQQGEKDRIVEYDPITENRNGGG